MRSKTLSFVLLLKLHDLETIQETIDSDIELKSCAAEVREEILSEHTESDVYYIHFKDYAHGGKEGHVFYLKRDLCVPLTFKPEETWKTLPNGFALSRDSWFNRFVNIQGDLYDERMFEKPYKGIELVSKGVPEVPMELLVIMIRDGRYVFVFFN